MNEVIVFDIDGTIANNEHRVHWVQTRPKNWKAFNAGIPNDVPYEDIKKLYMSFYHGYHNMILATGRGQEQENVTRQWLVNYNIPFNALYMRPAKDHRPDYVVKLELLELIRLKHGEPLFWFDDRDQVVEAIRGAGVRVFQVRKGDF